MAGAKKKPRIQASEIDVGKRTLESVLIDLAEQIKANDMRFAARTEQAEARSAEAIARSTLADERATIALQTIAAVSQDLRSLTQEFRTLTQEFRSLTQEFRSFAVRTDSRLDKIEKVVAP